MRFLLVAALVLGLFVPARAAKDIVVTDATFTCMKSWPKIEGRKARVFNARKRLLKKAIKVFVKAKPNKHFPVGTIVELIPPIEGANGAHVVKGEAMVKHKKGYNPDGNDWEFVVLDWNDADHSTVIVKQGKADIANIGPSCQGCHGGARTFDFICDNGRGRGGDCAPLNINAGVVAGLQDQDPRCPAAP